MITSQIDAKKFQDAGFSYEHPGFWDYATDEKNSTVSDGLNEDGLWQVQVVSNEGEYLEGEDFANVEDAITYAIAHARS